MDVASLEVEDLTRPSARHRHRRAQQARELTQNEFRDLTSALQEQSLAIEESTRAVERQRKLVLDDLEEAFAGNVVHDLTINTPSFSRNVRVRLNVRQSPTY